MIDISNKSSKRSKHTTKISISTTMVRSSDQYKIPKNQKMTKIP